MNDIRGFGAFDEKMRKAGLSDLTISTFRHYYVQLEKGVSGVLGESEIEPVASLPDADGLGSDLASAGRRALGSSVVIKLNGGLGTSMGLERAKSLLPVRGKLTFLDIVARQAERSGVPIYFMNSFSTEGDTREALAEFMRTHKGLVRDFRQSMVPKVLKQGLVPASWPKDPELEWCPPGHGDIYGVLYESGIIRELLAEGRRWAFVSNSDNLGAILDPAILGLVVRDRIPFLMEVADRTEADRKGGHLAQLKGGSLVLRESAQCPPSDSTAFQDFRKHHYFNTNNLWMDLEAVERVMRERRGIMGLPMIVNAKTLDPRDESSPAVYQLETAMGAAVSAIPGAKALRVPRRRFAPVKTTSDLLVVQSDAYVLDSDFNLLPDPKLVGRLPVVKLDARYYRRIDDFSRRFPRGAPSLVGCESFEVEGDVTFGSAVVASGRVKVASAGASPMTVADSTRLTN